MSTPAVVETHNLLRAVDAVLLQWRGREEVRVEPVQEALERLRSAVRDLPCPVSAYPRLVRSHGLRAGLRGQLLLPSEQRQEMAFQATLAREQWTARALRFHLQPRDPAPITELPAYLHTFRPQHPAVAIEVQGGDTPTAVIASCPHVFRAILRLRGDRVVCLRFKAWSDPADLHPSPSRVHRSADRCLQAQLPVHPGPADLLPAVCAYASLFTAPCSRCRAMLSPAGLPPTRRFLPQTEPLHPTC